jgi:ABC-type glycerol-3-phosphate transport system substrate-binding protein
MALLMGACRMQGDTGQGPVALDPPVNLQVLVSSGRISERFNRANLRKVMDGEVADFSRTNPRIFLHMRFVPEEEVLATVRKRTALGTGPDLVIARVPLQLVMAQEKLTEPSGLGDPDLGPLKIAYLDQFRQGKGYAALPFLLQPNLACYNRKAFPQAPASLAELLRRAEEGRRVGLSLVLDQLSWTASGFGAQEPLLHLFDTPPTLPAGQALSAADRPKALAWLQWLYRANVNPNVLFADTNEDLAERFMKRELDWISCNSAVVPVLSRALGKDLGLAVLPGESETKPARAVARMQMIGFGRDSSARQRQAAEQFALFLLNDYSQNTVMTRTTGVLPVNTNVIVPAKRSLQLAAIKQSQPQAIVPTFTRAVGVRLQRIPLTRLIKQNVYGDLSPEETLEEIQKLARNRSSGPPTTNDAALARPAAAGASRTRPSDE